ncbi:MAG: geranylgeranylglyceryl/heptaprenylglyceryl phosphate synthase [Cryomorphaceae bacterium]|nr:geranylgeranylglyceryl/heptaprenylglyceryl phosphate synthase [Cryomorphaceae bacterium]
MSENILHLLTQSKARGRALFSVLIDPDHPIDQSFYDRIMDAEKMGVDLFFVGGSLLANDYLDETIKAVRDFSNIPVILFPGSSLQVSHRADAILFLSLISGRNPDFLIGHHVMAAPYVKKANLEVLPTGYLLVDGGKATTAHYISQTAPIPHNKPSIAANTALAGEMLGLKLMYLDAGSGAEKPVSPEMIRAVSEVVNTPVIVGGGICDADQVRDSVDAGANVVVVGNILEKHPQKLKELIEAAKSFR